MSDDSKVTSSTPGEQQDEEMDMIDVPSRKRIKAESQESKRALMETNKQDVRNFTEKKKNESQHWFPRSLDSIDKNIAYAKV